MKEPGACLLLDSRRLRPAGNDYRVAGNRILAAAWPEVGLLLSQRQRHPPFRGGVCSAAPLPGGLLLTAGHCIQAENLPGRLLLPEFLAVAYLETAIEVTDTTASVRLRADRVWPVKDLLGGRFRTDGPDWALLASDHTLVGYSLAGRPPRVGEVCEIFGYPRGLSLRQTGRAAVTPPVRASEHFFWLDCRVESGVSGAPVVNSRGELVGIVCGETRVKERNFTRVQKIPSEVFSKRHTALNRERLGKP